MYHEMDISIFINSMEERCAAAGKPKLKLIRESRGLSQAELAKRADINVRNIRAYEQGDNEIDKAQAKLLYKLSRVLGCDVEDLLENPMA